MSAAAPISHWLATAEERAPAAGGLAAEVVDIAIVGGGYTGLSTALHAAEAGLSTQVIEAEEVGHGGSGRNAGLVNAGVWLPPAAVRARLGARYGPRFLERFARGPQTVFDLIERHQIRCEATREGTLHAAHSARGLADLRARHRDWAAMGEPVEMVDRERAAALIGSRAYVGALLDRRAGTINPGGYVRGLARAAEGAGARIATGVRATRLARDGDGWRVETDAGPLRARAVVLGTNAYADGLWPGLARSFHVIHYVQVATEPLGAHGAEILPGGQGLWDTAPIMTSLRRDRAGRLILGTMGRALPGITARWAARRLRALFPDLGPVAIETAWHGRIAMTADHMPRIHTPAPGLYTPVAYNGRGITTGTIFGQAIAGLLTGADPADLPLPVTGLAPERAPGLRSRVYDLAFTANQILRGA